MKAGWEIKKLGDICDLQNGYAFKAGDYVDKSNTLNIRMSNIRPGGNFDAGHNPRFLPESYADEYKNFLLKEGDLVIAMTDMAGDPKILGLPTLVSGLNGRNFLMNQRVGKLYKFSENIYIPYIRYFLSSPIVKAYYKKKGAGGLQINLSKKDILSVDVPLPPYAIQKEIVEKIDAALAEVEKATVAAIENAGSAVHLFQSYLNKTFNCGNETWKETTLGEYYDVRDGTHDSPKYIDNGFPLITSKNLKNGKLDFSNVQYIAEEDYSQINQRSGVKVGDVLMAMIGTIGNPVVIESEAKFAIKNVALFKTSKTQNPYFLRYYLMSTGVINSMAKDAKGATQKFVGLGYLRKFRITTPSLEVQNNIVESMARIEVLASELEDIFIAKQIMYGELKNSLLSYAFAGEIMKA